MSHFRLTGEKLLKYIAALVALIFILFALITVVVELRKPTDPVKRIVDEQCETVTQFGDGDFASTTKKPIGEFSLSVLMSDTAQCQLVVVPTAQTSEIQHLLFRKPVAERDYLYLSDRVVLLKRSTRNLKPYAEAVYNCVKYKKCNTDGLADSRHVIVFTAAFFGKKRYPVVSITFREFAFADAMKRAEKVLHAMLKTKNKNADFLEFRLYFHGDYTLLGSKELSWVRQRFVEGKDGLYMKSRGAKLRAMPWEMVHRPLLKAITKKGRQYGLKKDELEQKTATLYLFSTTIFREKDGTIEVSDG